MAIIIIIEKQTSISQPIKRRKINKSGEGKMITIEGA